MHIYYKILDLYGNVDYIVNRGKGYLITDGFIIYDSLVLEMSVNVEKIKEETGQAKEETEEK